MGAIFVCQRNYTFLATLVTTIRLVLFRIVTSLEGVQRLVRLVRLAVCVARHVALVNHEAVSAQGLE